MRRTGAMLLTTAALLGCASTAQAADVVNGDFETGDLSGWTVDSTSPQGSGYWFAYTGTVAPLTGVPLGSTVAPPPQGTYAALTDEVGPGRRILYQDVALDQVAQGGHLSLSLYAYYKAQQGALDTPSPETLDPNTPAANEQYRIDVMKPSAPLTSVAPGDILVEVFGTETGDPQNLAPTKLTADLTPFAGQTVRLRFAEVDNSGVLNAAADDVRIETVKPDPRIQLGTPTRDRSNGTATLPATSSEAGTLEISGQGIATDSLQVGEAGTFDLPVRPVQPLKKKVKKQRKGFANVVVDFTTPDGRTATAIRRVHLRNKRR